MASMGMDVDSKGNFYIATGKVGTSLAGYGGSGALVIISPTGSSVRRIYSLKATLADSRDVALSPKNDWITGMDCVAQTLVYQSVHDAITAVKALM